MAYAIEPQYAQTSRILDENGTALAKDTEKGKYKLIDMEGNILLHGMELVDTLNYLDGHGMVQTRHGDTLRLYTTLGQRVF